MSYVGLYSARLQPAAGMTNLLVVVHVELLATGVVILHGLLQRLGSAARYLGLQTYQVDWNWAG